MSGTIRDIDEHLIARASAGDRDALAALLDRHLHPAWRIALAASSTTAAAEAAVITGFCDALNAAGRHPDPTVTLRTRVAAAVHAAALAAHRAVPRPAPSATTANAVVAAFAMLPVASRTALWLTEVEGGEPAQAAPVLGVERGVAEAMARRARSALRDRIAGDAAARATDPVCAKVLVRLPAHAAERLPAEQRTHVDAHLATCTSCTATLALVTTPRPALRRIVTAVPASLPAAVAERWAEAGGRDRAPVVRRWNQRIAAAAAAAVVAVGLAGALLFGGGGSGNAPDVAAPRSVDLSDLADDPTPTTAALAAPVLPSGGPVLRPATPSTSDGERPRSNAPSPKPAPPATTTTTTAPPATTTTTAPPPSTTTTTTAPPPVAAADPDPGPVPPIVPPGEDCSVAGLPSAPAPVCDPATGKPKVEVPGLPAITLP